LSLLIRWAQRARYQAETPLIVLFRFPRPALSSHGDELTGNLANELDAISIDDRGLLRLFAEKSSRVDLGLLQQNLP
jgi:hypothetical protein